MHVAFDNAWNDRLAFDVNDGGVGIRQGPNPLAGSQRDNPVAFDRHGFKDRSRPPVVPGVIHADELPVHDNHVGIAVLCHLRWQRTLRLTRNEHQRRQPQRHQYGYGQYRGFSHDPILPNLILE